MNRRTLLLALLGLLLAPTGGAPRVPAQLHVVVFEDSEDVVLRALAAASEIDVRWVETGLVVAEVADPARLRPEWRGRVVGVRAASAALAVLRAPEREDLAGESRVLAKLGDTRLGSATAARGEVWVLAASPDTWPAEVLGCHGGLVLPNHHADPRSLIDTGPPEALRRWIRADSAPTAAQQLVLAEVSEDSLTAVWMSLTRAPSGQAADRHVFSPDLDQIYVPRVQASMQRFVTGIAGASVRRERFSKSRVCGTATVVDSTENVIARLPGSVPGTGTFVVCAHLDATGSRDPAWAADRNACNPVSATPGAEDNATGVACVLEVLRCVADGVRSAGLSFPFDLEFVAFSGEEAEGKLEPDLGGNALTGSARYIQRREQEGTKLLAALNLDMVGSDSLGTRLQVVHNPASRWLADLLIAAARAVSPPINLDLRRDLDESLASDHNSFWFANVPALLGADGPVDVLRRYSSYHRPRDTGQDVLSSKMSEVTRAFLAGILRFESGQQTASALVFPEGVKLFIAPQGDPLPYDADTGFFRLWPGSPLQASLVVVSTGAPYAGPLQIEMWVEANDGTERPIFTCTDAACFGAGGAAMPLQTGDRLDVGVESVPIEPQDTGEMKVRARVTYDLGGGSTTQDFETRFIVAAQSGLSVHAVPNPTRSLSAVNLAVALERPGILQTEIYNAAGRRVATLVQSVEPNFQTREGIVDVPLAGTMSDATVPSGVYYARVLWLGPGGQQESSIVRLIVVR
ncbi:MAG TPA: M28 family peptidase [Candidatus Krumholzibacteria bacterium]|nr:M28 family peptidase [Candidatus Krumholzibacteria bacterium]